MMLEYNSNEDIRDYLKQSMLTDANAQTRIELGNYVDDALMRFQATLDYLPTVGEDVLELGANPYFFTLLMKKFRKFRLELSNFFHPDPDGKTIYTQIICNEKYGEEHEFSFRQFNVEKQRFPYADASFDGVLFCEILEHLVEDPVAALAEIHRILRPGGWLLLTTPNIASVKNIMRLSHGQNIYDVYSGYGYYGRHNREYTLCEVRDLLSSLGFSVRRIATQQIYHRRRRDIIKMKLQSLFINAKETEDNIFCLAEKTGSCGSVRPPWLYRSI